LKLLEQKDVYASIEKYSALVEQCRTTISTAADSQGRRTVEALFGSIPDHCRAALKSIYEPIISILSKNAVGHLKSVGWPKLALTLDPAHEDLAESKEAFVLLSHLIHPKRYSYLASLYIRLSILLVLL
jgi:hypothetical protein